MFEFLIFNDVDIDQGIHKEKLKSALNEKLKKLYVFSFTINMANFEAFRWTKKLTSNLFFLKSVERTLSILPLHLNNPLILLLHIA